MKISDIKPKAVLIGFILAISAYSLVFVFLGLLLGVISFIRHDTSDAIWTAIKGSISWKIGILILSILTICWGGYVAVRRARSSIFWNSFAVGFLFMTFNIIALAVLPPSRPIPPWEFWFNFVVTIPAALLGGYIGKRRRQSILNDLTKRRS